MAGFTTEIDEMSRIPFRELLSDTTIQHQVFVSGVRPARNSKLISENAIYAVLSLG
jgi:hypothetical protein